MNTQKINPYLPLILAFVTIGLYILFTSGSVSQNPQAAGDQYTPLEDDVVFGPFPKNPQPLKLNDLLCDKPRLNGDDEHCSNLNNEPVFLRACIARHPELTPEKICSSLEYAKAGYLWLKNARTCGCRHPKAIAFGGNSWKTPSETRAEQRQRLREAQSEFRRIIGEYIERIEALNINDPQRKQLWGEVKGLLLRAIADARMTLERFRSELERIISEASGQ